ncbi:MAG: hypothetical protein GYB26_13790 [Gammaproteobacteria bacterium]|nr:hypothetical protein [Gammaproteobacteria bacterium]
MNAIYKLLAVFVPIFVFFGAARAIYRQLVWRLNRRYQNSAAEAFKSNNEPVCRINEEKRRSLARVLWRESINGAVSKEPFDSEDVGYQVYRVANPEIAEKDWRFSNSAASVVNKLNGFEFFVPGMARRWLLETKPQSLDIVFYKNIAVLVGSGNEFDLFREERAGVLRVPGLQARQNAIETWYEAPATCATFTVPPINGGGLVRAIRGDTMVLFSNWNSADTYMLVIGVAGIFSTVLGIFVAAFVMDAFESRYFFTSSFFETFLTLLPVLWGVLVSGFLIRERFRFRFEPMLFVDREASFIYSIKAHVPRLEGASWASIAVRVSSQFGYLVGTIFSVSDSKLEFVSLTDPNHLTAEFGVNNMFDGLCVWKTISMFMNREINNSSDIIPCGKTYQQGDPLQDGLWLLKRRVKSSFPVLPFPAKVLHSVLFLLTLGPLPYILANQEAKARLKQAFKVKSQGVLATKLQGANEQQ